MGHTMRMFMKNRPKTRKYFGRIKAVRKELGLPRDPQWDSIDYVERGKAYHATH